MTVYVDDMRAPFSRMVMCHLIADTPVELLEMARKIGVATHWIQNQGGHYEHFNISLGSRAKAVKLGAKEIAWRDC